MAMQLVDPGALDTLPKLLLHNAANWPDEIAQREKDLGIWHGYSWRDQLERVREIALGLHALGLRRGEVVALIGRNRPNWVWGALAAQSLGAMTLGIYADVLAHEAGHLLRQAGSRIVLAEDEEQVDKLLELGQEAPELGWIVHHDPRGMRKYADPRLVAWDELIARGREALARDPGLFEREVAAGRGEEVAILCTTSGTTALPKLAMLQHRPFLRHCAAYLRADPRGPLDDYVSVLPLPWIMEQVYVLAMPLLSRIRVAFPESQDTVMQDLREIGPTHLLLAPRVWEQIAAEVRTRMMDASRANRLLFDLAMRLAEGALDRGRTSRLAHMLVLGTLRDRLGFARLRSAATGGSALGPDTFRFFLAIGVPLRQLYGQTELSGAYTIQRGAAIDFDSSGPPFDNTELRIADPDPQGVGEIQTRHEGLFKGYLGQEAARAEVLTADGFMRTGDAGYLDRDGRLVVIDRLKDIATTTAGIRFSPQFIENKLKFSPYVGECVVLGAGRPWLAAILCIRYSLVAKWAEARGLAFTGYGNLASRPEVCELLAGEVRKVNASLPEGQRLHRFLLLHKELDADDGELTRTRKVRRSVIDERYAPLIQAIYAGAPRVALDTVVTFEDGSTAPLHVELEIRHLEPPLLLRPEAA